MIMFSTITASSGSLVDIDATLLIQLGLFLFMLLVLTHLVFKPVIALIEARREATEGMMASAVALEKEAATLNASVSEKLQESRKEAVKEREKRLFDATLREREIMTKAREEAHEKITSMKQRAVSDLSDTRAKLISETAMYVSEVTAKILGRRPSE